jgi:two-component system, NtrC family, sensor kinase
MNLKKILAFLLAVVLTCSHTNAQQDRIRKLQHELTFSGNDSSKAIILDSLSLNYLFFTYKPDSSSYYINQLIDLAFKLPEKKFLILAYSRKGFYYINIAQYKAALDISLKGIKLCEQFHSSEYLSSLYNNIIWVYLNVNDSRSALNAAVLGKSFFATNDDRFLDEPLHFAGLLGNIYLNMDKKDSAFYFFSQMGSLASNSKELAAKDISDWYWGMYYLYTKDYFKTDSFLRVGINSCEKNGDFLLNSFHLYLAQSLIEQRKFHQAITEARIGRLLSQAVQDKNSEASGASMLNICYDKLGNRDSAYYFLKIGDSLNAVVLSNGNAYDIQQINFSQQLGQKEEESALAIQNEKNRNRIVLYIFFTALFFFGIILVVQWRYNQQRKKANQLLLQQKQKVESTLSTLKSTQAQLIQSEKMASLGELTAGIAHEIQNPLNFVNNFSEVNNELIADLKTEIEKGNLNEIKSIADAIAANGEKINHHGKRADAIVKGMLQHSQKSTGQKLSTNINALTAEYLRLAYHSLRAKDKSFSAEIKTDFDESIGNIEVIPQDIGRVLLNLCNNALYAVSEKKKQHPLDYEPVVSVHTRKINDKVQITIRDNGTGMPQKVIDKIFQPFFTTKPTGQGTGLGLSISYDIIKAHSGELKAETKEGEFAQFIVQLPA